eukprot:scaffold130865_cov69-Phaeocystis_antarctica.AAC.6
MGARAGRLCGPVPRAALLTPGGRGAGSSALEPRGPVRASGRAPRAVGGRRILPLPGRRGLAWAAGSATARGRRAWDHASAPSDATMTNFAPRALTS